MSQTKAQLIDGKSSSIEFTAGSASTPSIYFTSDINTGIYSPGADQVGISTGGTGRMFVDASGRVLVGTSSAFNGVPNGANINLLSSDQFGPQFGMRGTHNSSDPLFLLMDRARGSSVVQSGDTIMQFDSRGFDGTNYLALARIAAFVDGTPGTNDMPGRLVFSTTADGASSVTERMRISQNGVVTIKNGAVAEIGTLVDGATITPDLSTNCNFTVTLGGNRTLANPTNITAGQSGSIFIVQDATGSRVLSWGSYWDFSGGTAPTLTTTANAIDRVDYVVRSATSIQAVFTANYS
jgi:hypothetical protein